MRRLWRKLTLGMRWWHSPRPLNSPRQTFAWSWSAQLLHAAGVAVEDGVVGGGAVGQAAVGAGSGADGATSEGLRLSNITSGH